MQGSPLISCLCQHWGSTMQHKPPSRTRQSGGTGVLEDTAVRIVSPSPGHHIHTCSLFLPSFSQCIQLLSRRCSCPHSACSSVPHDATPLGFSSTFGPRTSEMERNIFLPNKITPSLDGKGHCVGNPGLLLKAARRSHN